MQDPREWRLNSQKTQVIKGNGVPIASYLGGEVGSLGHGHWIETMKAICGLYNETLPRHGDDDDGNPTAFNYG